MSSDRERFQPLLPVIFGFVECLTLEVHGYPERGNDGIREGSRERVRCHDKRFAVLYGEVKHGE